MSVLLSKMALWCSCDIEHEAYPQYQIVKEDWHAEQVKMQCPHCGHKVIVERSYVSPTGTNSAAQE